MYVFFCALFHSLYVILPANQIKSEKQNVAKELIFSIQRVNGIHVLYNRK